MSHDNSAARIAGFLVVSLFGYWALIEIENHDAGPPKVGLGAETCGNWGELLGTCQKRTAYVRAETGADDRSQ